MGCLRHSPGPSPVRAVLVCLVLAALAACGNSPSAPVEDRGYGGVHGQGYPTHRVQRGDTLYSIAFRYGMDYRKVAAANNIYAPYTIYPGQVIVVRETPPTAAPLATAAAVPAGTPPVVAPYPAAAPVVSTPSSSPAPSSAPAPAVPPISAPAVPPISAPASTVAPASAAAPSTAAQAAAPVASEPYTGAVVTNWRWPTEGRVTRGYSGTVHKGIDIDGSRGDAVRAVAPGKVVYAGTGIVGFGELLIVKHNDVYLSAYGHNDRLLVSEGQAVQAGQQIAEKGSSGTDTVKLHFEIREAGKPIDPLRLLPSR